MPILDYKSEIKKSSLSWLFMLPVGLLIVILSNFPEWELRYKSSGLHDRSSPEKYNPVEKMVTMGPDDKGQLHGRIFQHLFRQNPETYGRSPDELMIRFQQKAQIRGILMSVDCWKPTRLVELAAGINQKPAYMTNGPQDMLFHVSFATNNTAGKIDEHIWFPEPIPIKEGDFINIGAWIQNISGTEQSVSPEIIIYFNWMEPNEELSRKKKS